MDDPLGSLLQEEQAPGLRLETWGGGGASANRARAPCVNARLRVVRAESAFWAGASWDSGGLQSLGGSAGVIVGILTWSIWAV